MLGRGISAHRSTLTGITSGLAKLIIEKRAELEAVFAVLDQMTAHAKALVPEVAS